MTDLTPNPPQSDQAADTSAQQMADSTCNAKRTGRNPVNFWLDIATAFVFSAIVSTGVLLEFVLVRRGGGTWLGASRHDWAQVHFWLGTAMLALVVAHLILHRAWIASCWRRYAGSLRSPLTYVLLGTGLLLVLLPLLIPVQPGRGNGGRGRHWRTAAGDAYGDGSRAHAPRRGRRGPRSAGFLRRRGDDRRRGGF